MGFWAAVPAIISAGAGVVGGDGDKPKTFPEAYMGMAGTRCPRQPPDTEVIRAVRNAPQSEVDRIISILRSTNGGIAPGSREQLMDPQTVQLWATAMMGGSDCTASSMPEQPRIFLDFVGKYGTDTGVPSSGTSAPLTNARPTEASQAPGIEDNLQGVVRGIGSVIEDAVRSATEGARRTVDEASRASEESRAKVSAGDISTETLVIGGIGAVALVVLIMLFFRG